MKRKPHVLKIAPTPFFADRGCHVRILEEVRVLQARGYRVTLCTYHFGNDPEGVTIRRSLRVPWYDKLSAGPSVHKFYVDPLLAWTVLRTCRRDRPDVIHAYLHEGIVIGWLAAALFGVPLVADLQGSLTAELIEHRFFRRGGLLHRLFRNLEAFLLRLPAGFLLSSFTTVEGFASDPSELRAPAVILADGVDTEVFHPARPGERLREELSLPSGDRIVGYLGLLNEYQGVPVLLEAARRVLDERDDVRFLVMGYPDVERYRKQADQLGLGDRVMLPGRIDYTKARDYLAACDVGVSAKRAVSEANGKLLNYMAVGIPIVCTDTPVNRSIVGDLGVYADVDDPSSLAGAINKVLDDPEGASRLGKRLRRRAVEQLSWSAGGDLIEALYRRLAPGLSERKVSEA